MSIVIRKTKEQDAEKILRYLEKTSGQSDHLSYKPEELRISLEEEEQYIKNFDKANSIFLIAEDNSEILGKITLSGGKTRRTQHVAELSISVDKDHWGRGIGLQLLEKAEEWASSTNIIKKITLKVNANNYAAISLYRKKGFEEEGLLKNEMNVNGKYVDSILMAKMLSTQ